MTTRTRRSKSQKARDALLALLKDQEAEAKKHQTAYTAYMVSIQKVTSTRKVIELLDQAMLPGLGPEPHVEPGVTLTDVVVAVAELAEGVLRPLPSSLTSSTDNEVETQLVQSNVGVLEDEPTPLAYICICHHDPATGYRLDIVCPVHDGVNTGHLPLDNRDVQTDVSVSRPHRQRIGEEAQQLLNDVWNPKDGNSVTVHSRLMYSRQESCELCRAGVPFATEKRTQHRVVPSDEAKVKWGVEHRPCTGIEKVA